MSELLKVLVLLNLCFLLGSCATTKASNPQPNQQARRSPRTNTRLVTLYKQIPELAYLGPIFFAYRSNPFYVQWKDQLNRTIATKRPFYFVGLDKAMRPHVFVGVGSSKVLTPILKTFDPLDPLEVGKVVFLKKIQ